VYDRRIGEPDGAIAPGVAFEEIPSTWRCPMCDAHKSDFTPVR
jgi:rubredoxin